MIFDRSKSIKTNTYRKINCVRNYKPHSNTNMIQTEGRQVIAYRRQFQNKPIESIPRNETRDGDLRLETEARGHDSRARVCK